MAAEDGADEEQAKLEYPLYLDGVGYWDEHHRQVRFGHASKFEVRIRRDSSGRCSASGDLQPRKPTTIC